MKTVYLILLFHASLQLQCDKKQITAPVGGEFILICTYETNHYLYSKKYWCRGGSRDTCEILVDSEGRANTKSTHRSLVVDARQRGLFVKVTKLQFDDAGVYWVGIDKIYTDIMTSVKVVVTQVPVSTPRLWPLSSLVNRSTCWGEPITVRCNCAKGTAIHYKWYHKRAVIHNSPDLQLQCGKTVRNITTDFYCVANNDISSQRSGVLSVQVFLPADSDCIYVVNIQGQPVYDCADRMTTTTQPTTQPTTPFTCQATVTVHSGAANTSGPFNETDQFVSRSWMGNPLCYTFLRWICFAALLIFLCIFHICARTKPKRAKRRCRHLAQRPSHRGF
ncbi:polymeric immunoglobulin receptor-like [Xyrichtys novacula]|nr:polymeric immunoglobulin receptor-like [Xyrichtys novacula]